MCCTPTRFVNITINNNCCGFGGFMPFSPLPFSPIGGFYNCNWAFPNPVNIFAYGFGASLGHEAARGLRSLLA